MAEHPHRGRGGRRDRRFVWGELGRGIMLKMSINKITNKKKNIVLGEIKRKLK